LTGLAAVQPFRMDALTLIRGEHRRLEGLLERCERLGEGSGGERAVLLGQLQAAIRHHVDQEEPILYTIYRERARRAGVDLASLERALEQHRLIDRLGRELSGAEPDDTGEAKLTVLTERVRTHLDDEDAAVLTAIEDLIDDGTLLELGRRMEQRDRVLEARRELAAVVPGGRRGRRVAAALGGLVAAGTALLAVLARRRRPPPPSPTGWRRLRRR
jgi:hemerythrin-like domain-containing protein